MYLWRNLLQKYLFQNFYNKYFRAVGVAHQSEMNELSEIVTAEQLVTSQLASKFRCEACHTMSHELSCILALLVVQVHVGSELWIELVFIGLRLSNSRSE